MPQPLRSATSSSRFRRLGLTAALLTLAPAAPALAVPLVPVPQELPLRTVFDGTMSPTAGQSSKACQAAYRPGAPGVATREISVTPGIGLLELTMTGTGGDADVAVFDTAGNPLAAAASPDAQETAAGWTLHRRHPPPPGLPAATGTSDVRVQVVVRRGRCPPTPRSAQARVNPPQLVSVKAPTQAERSRVAGLGLRPHRARQQRQHRRGRPQRRADRAKAHPLRTGLRRGDAGPRRPGPRGALGPWRTALRRRAARAGLPSGDRTTYRTLADYEIRA